VPEEQVKLTVTKEELLRKRLQKARERQAEGAATLRKLRPGEPKHLSPNQRRLWFLEQFDEGSASYNMYITRRLKGKLDSELLRRAGTALLRRHEILRCVYVLEGEEPVMKEHPQPEIDATSFISEDFTSLPLDEREGVARERMSRALGRSFGLDRELPLRFYLYKLEEEEHLLLVLIHHIACDAQSVPIFMRELAAEYEGLVNGQGSGLAPLPVQYADYAAWQREELNGEKLAKLSAYWQKTLRGAPELLVLPVDRRRPAVQSNKGAVYRFQLTGEILQRVRQACVDLEVTSFMYLLSAFYILLCKYTGEKDLVVGVPVSGRTRTEVEPLIGVFVNTLVFRTELAGTLSVRELVQRVRETALGAYEHQDMPFEKIIEELNPQRNLSYSPIFQVLFNHIKKGTPVCNFKRLTDSAIPMEFTTAKFDLSLEISEKDEVMDCLINYCTEQFFDTTIVQFAAYFVKTVGLLTENREKTIDELDIISITELKLLAAKIEQLSLPLPAGTDHASPEIDELTDNKKNARQLTEKDLSDAKKALLKKRLAQARKKAD
jgi:hypothetical protein